MVEKEVFAGLAAGNQVLKELHKEMSLSDVEKLMDETAESIAYQDEIDEMLSTRLSVAEEEDIEAELDAMVVKNHYQLTYRNMRIGTVELTYFLKTISSGKGVRRQIAYSARKGV